MDDRRAEREVKQRGNAHAVEKEAGVAGVGAADRVEGERPDDLRNTRQRFDHPKRIAARPRGRPRLLPVDANGARDRLRGDDGLEHLTARGQPYDDRLPGRRQIDSDIRCLMTGRDDLKVVVAGRDQHGEGPGRVGLGDGLAVDEHAGRLQPQMPAARQHGAVQQRGRGHDGRRRLGARRRVGRAGGVASAGGGVDRAGVGRAGVGPGRGRPVGPVRTVRAIRCWLDRNAAVGLGLGRRRELRRRPPRQRHHQGEDQQPRAQGGSVVSQRPSREAAARPRTVYATSTPASSLPAAVTPVTARASDWRSPVAMSTSTSSPLSSWAL